LGIVEASPTQKLHINGSIRLSAGNNLWIGAESDAGDRMRFHQSGADGFIDWGGGTLFFRSGASGVTNQFSIGGSGNIIARDNVTGYGTPSDKRYKNTILPIRHALNTILKLDGVTFRWNEDTDQYKMTGLIDDIGFIAQQVQTVAPELVREGEDGYLSIRERAIIPMLVEAIKEQQQQIDELKNKLGTE
jgi:hypothetical protein